MKKLLSAGLALFLGFILLSSAVPVNHFAVSPSQNGSRTVADGVPLPPPIPHKGGVYSSNDWRGLPV
jgi:hypothetical protein